MTHHRSLVLAVAFTVGLAGCPGDPADDEPSGAAEFDATVRVEGGDWFAVAIAPDEGLVPDPTPAPGDRLDGDAAAAVARAPGWVQTALARTLEALDADEADALAQPILDADELWVDEVAWSIAVTDAALLAWIVGEGDEALFLENAEGIYRVDGALDHASLVELGDGRTTVEAIGEDGAYEIDPDDYYWHVVYPRAYLELPGYWDGDWWRTLFVEDDTHGQTLLDAVAGAATVLEAAEAVGDWVQSFMTFGYGTNELWPVDIYWSQFGSCGQYSILTTAAARTVLIPTVSVSARADDHEWNELWDGRWVMWDNSLGEIGNNPNYPYIDWPEVFDDDSYDGAGVLGEVNHVFRFRGDEFTWPSELYTEYLPVEVRVTDADGAPVEGARVVARARETDYWPCAWTCTDADGVARFELGDDLGYGFEINHPTLGDLPDDGVYQTEVALWVDEDEYVFEAEYDDALPRDLDDEGAPPAGTRRVEVSLAVVATEHRVANVITEGYELDQTYPQLADGGAIDVYVVDADGMRGLDDGDDDVDAFGVRLAVDDASFQLELPADETWYLVIDNRPWPTSHRDVDLRVALPDD